MRRSHRSRSGRARRLGTIVSLDSLCREAYIDGCLAEMRFWERAVILGFVGFIASTIALAIAAFLLFRFRLEVMFFGIFAIVPAALCSLLSQPAPEPPNLPRAG